MSVSLRPFKRIDTGDEVTPLTFEMTPKQARMGISPQISNIYELRTLVMRRKRIAVFPNRMPRILYQKLNMLAFG